MNLKKIFVLSAGLCCSLAFSAAVPADRFPFPIPWDDATPGTATDLSFLNDKPAGKNGHIVVRGGKFVESGTGEVKRFIGINLGAGGLGAFPLKEEAEKFAAHLAKAGINLVRFHNLDGKNPIKTVFDTRHQDTQHFNEEHLDRLFYFIAQLKKNGIYSNFNLRVMRAATPKDGIPKFEREEYPQKMLNRFPPRWIELQKLYAKEMLTRKNPYTGLSMAEDPAIIAVEIDNENSILTYGPRFGELSGFYKEEMTKLWNRWLLRRYQTDEALRAAWGGPKAGELRSIIPSDISWRVESGHSGSEAYIADEKTNQDGMNVKVDVEHGGSMFWHVQAQLLGLDLENEQDYTLTFKVKSDRKHGGSLAVQRDIPNWEAAGLRADFNSGKTEQEYVFSFIAKNTVKRHSRLTFFLGGSGRKPRQFELSAVRLYRGNPFGGLKPGESLQKQNISLPVSGTKAQLQDGLQFLVDLDREFAVTMRNYLKDELKVKALVIDSQISYGGVIGYHRESDMDYADAHCYWQHPEFIGQMWNFALGNWKIGNTSQVEGVATGNHTDIQRTAALRLFGKPFSLSEYDMAFPNEYASEMMPFLAVVGNLQDWDAIYLFCNGNYGSFGASDFITGTFDNTNHPGKFGYYPAAMLAFRTGAFEPLEECRVLNLPEKSWAQGYFNVYDIWKEKLNGSAPEILKYRVGVASKYLAPSSPASLSTVPGKKAPQAQIVRRNGKTFLTAFAPRCSVVTGCWGGESFDFGPVALKFKPFDGNFGAVMVNSLNEEPIVRSDRVLLTIAGKFENLDMKWNDAHNGVGEPPGHAPVCGIRLDGEIAITTDGPRKVYYLDVCGVRQGETAAAYADGKLRIPVRPEHGTMYYEIVR